MKDAKDRSPRTCSGISVDTSTPALLEGNPCDRMSTISPSAAPRRSPKVLSALAIGLGVLTGCGSSSTPSQSGTAQTSQASACAWPIEDNYLTNNKGLLDSAAWIWAQPFAIHVGTQLVVSGRYPDARYASFSVYSSSETAFTSNGVGSSLADYQIAPDSGSVNPWRRSALPGGRFSLTLRAQVSPGQANVMPLAPEGNTSGVGYLEYRVYLPASGDASQIPLPEITLHQGGSSSKLLACISHTMAIPPPNAGSATARPATPAAKGTSRPALLQFVRAAFNTYFPNPDTAYLLAAITPPAPSDVIVVTAKAPTFPAGAHPSVWPSADDEVRYWSMCVNLGVGTSPVVVNHLPNGQTDVGCRADEATSLSANGYYTYVIGTEAQRSSVEHIAGVTFLPLSLTQPAPFYYLALRYTLANPTFAAAPQNIAQADSAVAAAAVMGPFYPHAEVCPLSILTTRGMSACG